MNFTCKKIKKDPFFSVKNSEWLEFQGLSTNKRIIYGVILGVVLAAILAEFIKFFILGKSFDFYFYKKLYLFFLIIPMHELIHAIFCPNLKKTTIGFSTKHIAFFVISDGIFTKKRFITIILMPLLALTIIPLIILFFFSIEIIAYIALYNLLASGIDIISLIELSKQNKKNLFQFNGEDLYVKAPLG